MSMILDRAADIKTDYYAPGTRVRIARSHVMYSKIDLPSGEHLEGVITSVQFNDAKPYIVKVPKWEEKFGRHEENFAVNEFSVLPSVIHRHQLPAYQPLKDNEQGRVKFKNYIEQLRKMKDIELVQLTSKEIAGILSLDEKYVSILMLEAVKLGILYGKREKQGIPILYRLMPDCKTELPIKSDRSAPKFKKKTEAAKPFEPSPVEQSEQAVSTVVSAPEKMIPSDFDRIIELLDNATTELSLLSKRYKNKILLDEATPQELIAALSAKV